MIPGDLPVRTPSQPSMLMRHATLVAGLPRSPALAAGRLTLLATQDAAQSPKPRACRGEAHIPSYLAALALMPDVQNVHGTPSSPTADLHDCPSAASERGRSNGPASSGGPAPADGQGAPARPGRRRASWVGPRPCSLKCEAPRGKRGASGVDGAPGGLAYVSRADTPSTVNMR